MQKFIQESSELKRSFGPIPHYPWVKSYLPKSKDLKIVAGPCSIESKEQIDKIVPFLSKNKVTYMRGGVFRTGTYPSRKFGYIDRNIIEHYCNQARNWMMKPVIECLDYRTESLNFIKKNADVIQIGARSMQNYQLLHLVAELEKPIFLKRHHGSTLDEFLGAAEHILSVNSKADITLIERGSSSFHNHVRWDLSISIIPTVKNITKMPILVDASHGTGNRHLVEPMTLAGLAAGSDGYLVEVHENPNQSLSDAEQAINFESFKRLSIKANRLKEMMRVPIQ